MALRTRTSVLTARLLLGAAGFFGPKPLRFWAWRAHDIAWLYPTLQRNSQWHGPVATHFITEEKEVWLTIDDGPDPETTPVLLDLLKEHGAKATFFVIGRQVEQHRALCRRILAEGHSLGNHTYSHPAAGWWAWPRPLVKKEIALGNEALLTVSGKKTRWFRSPVGMNNSAVHPVAHRAGHRVIGWSAAGGDGCPVAPTKVCERIMSQVKPGAIIVLHEGGRVRRRAQTLSRVLEALEAEGYRCVLPKDACLR